MSGFIMGFCSGIGWVAVLLVFWIVRTAFTASLDLGD